MKLQFNLSVLEGSVLWFEERCSFYLNKFRLSANYSETN